MHKALHKGRDGGSLTIARPAVWSTALGLLQGKARSILREPSSVDVTTVPDSQAELVEPGGSPPTQLQPLTDEQAPFFSRLPSFQMPTGRRVHSVQCSLSALTDGFVCKFADGLRAVSGMQSMLQVFKQPSRYASNVDRVDCMWLVLLPTMKCSA